MRTLVILFAVAAASAEAGAQASTVEKELVAARDTVWHAYFANDTVLLRRFIPPSDDRVDRSNSRPSPLM